MGRIRIGGTNLIREPGVVLTAGSEAADHPVSNLKIPAPSEFLRLDSLTASHVLVDLLRSRAYDMAAILYSTATVQRTLLTDVATLDTGANWTQTEVTLTQTDQGLSIQTGAGVPFLMLATVTVAEHKIEHDEDLFAFSTVTSSAHRFVLTTEIVSFQSSANLRLRIDVGAEFVQADFDLTNVIIDSTSESTALTVKTSIVQLTPSGNIRCTITGDLPLGVVATTAAATATIQVLDSAFASSYSGVGESILFNVPKFHVGDKLVATALESEEIYEEGGAESGGLWILKRDTATLTPTTLTPDEFDLASTVASDVMTTWDSQLGWSHAWLDLSIPANPTTTERFLLFELHDADNADAQIDLSTIWVGRTFEPATNFKETLQRRWQEDTNPNTKYSPVGEKMRRWELDLHYLTKTEAEVDLDEILLLAGQSREVLVILDPDDTVTGQQNTIYGKLVQHGVRQVGFDGTLKQVRYAVSLEIVESVP